MRGLLTVYVVVLVTLVWAIVFLASIYTKEYTPMIYVSGPMLAVVGYATGVTIVRNGRVGRRNREPR